MAANLQRPATGELWSGEITELLLRTEDEVNMNVAEKVDVTQTLTPSSSHICWSESGAPAHCE